MFHQYVTLTHAVNEELSRVQMFHGIGTGKTLTALWLAKRMWQSPRILVVCPRSAFRGWKRDAGGPMNMSYMVVEDKDPQNRRDMLCEDRDLYMINYAGLKSVYGIKRKGAGWYIDHSQFTDNFDCLILDEEHRCKDENSIQSKICYQLSMQARYAIGLTGTPYVKALTDLYALMKVIDLGNSLGANSWTFFEQYYHKESWGWVENIDAEAQILREILWCSTSFTREECLPNLPGRVDNDLEIIASTEQRNMIKRVMSGLAVEVGNGVINASNVLARISKVQQIAGGFVYLIEDDERSIHIFKKNPKLDALAEVVEQHPGKIIVWHMFEEEAHIIERWAEEHNIGYASLRGEIDDKDEEERAFIEDPGCRLMIAHAACASESLDFTCSYIEFFYSCNGSIVDREQCEGRIRRNLQTKKQLFLNAVMLGTFDEITMARIESRQETANRILGFIRKYGR